MKRESNIQSELSYTYNSAQARMSANPEHAAKHRKILDRYQFLKSEEEALERARHIKENNPMDDCQIWASLDKDEEFYFYSDKWIATGDIDILLAAEYLGFAQVYDYGQLDAILSK